MTHLFCPKCLNSLSLVVFQKYHFNLFPFFQVWFQNARAKWRRTKAQDGTGNPAGMISGSQSIPPAPASSSSGLSGPEDGLDGLGGPVSPCSDDVSASDMDLRHDTMLLAWTEHSSWCHFAENESFRRKTCFSPKNKGHWIAKWKSNVPKNLTTKGNVIV